MYCSNCGYKINEDANFCSSCGTKINKELSNNITEQEDNKEILTPENCEKCNSSWAESSDQIGAWKEKSNLKLHIVSRLIQI